MGQHLDMGHARPGPCSALDGGGVHDIRYLPVAFADKDAHAGRAGSADGGRGSRRASLGEQVQHGSTGRRRSRQGIVRLDAVQPPAGGALGQSFSERVVGLASRIGGDDGSHVELLEVLQLVVQDGSGLAHQLAGEAL